MVLGNLRNVVDLMATRLKSMPKAREMTTKASEPDKVEAYIGNLKHPLVQVVKDLRKII